MAGLSIYIKATYTGPPKVNGYTPGVEYEIKVMQRYSGEITVQASKKAEKKEYMDVVRFFREWKNINK